MNVDSLNVNNNNAVSNISKIKSKFEPDNTKSSNLEFNLNINNSNFNLKNKAFIVEYGSKENLNTTKSLNLEEANLSKVANLFKLSSANISSNINTNQATMRLNVLKSSATITNDLINSVFLK